MEPAYAIARGSTPYTAPRSSATGFSLGAARTAILDTDYILNQVARLVDDPVTAFERPGPPFRGEQTFASKHVLTELYQPDKLGNRNKWEKLAGQALARGIVRAPTDYQDMFESSFLPLIGFVDVSGMFEHEPAVELVGAKDAKDAPTAQLAILLSRTKPLVYSNDRSLWKPGLAVQPESFEAVVEAGWQADAGQSTLAAAGYVSFGAVWGLDAAARRVAGVFEIPDWVTRLALVGGAVLIVAGKERRDKIVRLLSPVGRFLLCALQEAATATALLADSAARVQANDRLECHVAEVLSDQPTEAALLAREIHEELMCHRLEPSAPYSVNDVRDVLRRHPCFVEGPKYRFRLGVRPSGSELPTPKVSSASLGHPDGF